jgi:hypothetical protein
MIIINFSIGLYYPTYRGLFGILVPNIKWCPGARKMIATLVAVTPLWFTILITSYNCSSWVYKPAYNLAPHCRDLFLGRIKRDFEWRYGLRTMVSFMVLCDMQPVGCLWGIGTSVRKHLSESGFSVHRTIQLWPEILFYKSIIAYYPIKME